MDLRHPQLRERAQLFGEWARHFAIPEHHVPQMNEVANHGWMGERKRTGPNKKKAGGHASGGASVRRRRRVVAHRRGDLKMRDVLLVSIVVCVLT